MKITIDLDTTKSEDCSLLVGLGQLLTAQQIERPPASFQSHGPSDKPTPVHVWAPEGKEEQAAAHAELAENCEIVPESTDIEPTPRPPKTKAKPAKSKPTKRVPAGEPSKSAPVDNAPIAENKKTTPEGIQLRKKLLEACGPDGEYTDEAKQVICKAGGVDKIGNLPKEKTPDAIAKLDEFILEKGITA